MYLLHLHIYVFTVFLRLSKFEIDIRPMHIYFIIYLIYI